MSILEKIFRRKKNYNIQEIERKVHSYSPQKIKESVKRYSRFERACAFAERTLKLRAPKKSQEKLNESILMIDLEITPNGIFSLTILLLIGLLIATIPFFFLLGSSSIFLPFIGSPFRTSTLWGLCLRNGLGRPISCSGSPWARSTTHSRNSDI